MLAVACFVFFFACLFDCWFVCLLFGGLVS